MHAGRDGQEDAIAVFTVRSVAEVYLTQAGWVETETVAELETAAFLRWLLQATDSGPKLIAINPDRVHQDDTIRQTVIFVADLLRQLGPAITE